MKVTTNTNGVVKEMDVDPTLWGNRLSKLFKPVAKGVDAIAGTDLQNCPGCAGRQAALNDLGKKIDPR